MFRVEFVIFRDFLFFFIAKFFPGKSQFSKWIRLKKKCLHESIKTFYDLNHDKGKPYTLKHFKTSGYSERQMFHIMNSFDVTKSRNLWNPKLREIHEWEDSFLDLWVAKCQSAPVEALGNVRQTALWSWIVSCKNSLPMDLKYFDWELLSNMRMGLGLFV